MVCLPGLVLTALSWTFFINKNHVEQYTDSAYAGIGVQYKSRLSS